MEIFLGFFVFLFDVCSVRKCAKWGNGFTSSNLYSCFFFLIYWGRKRHYNKLIITEYSSTVVESICCMRIIVGASLVLEAHKFM